MTMTELTEEQREERRTRTRNLIEARLTETWPAWRRLGRKPNLGLAADIALDSLGELAAEILVDGTMMRSLTIRDGVATLELAEATELVTIFAAGMRGCLSGNGASNYVEMEMTDRVNGDAFTVTVQRRERPTPHEFRQQAEARVAELTAELEESQNALAVARQVLGTVTTPPETTADKAAALGMDPTDYRRHSHDTAVERVREAARGLYADTGIRVMDVLDGVTPAQTDRAAILREAADAIVADNDRQMWASKPGQHWAADLLYRLADEAQQPTDPATEEPTR